MKTIKIIVSIIVAILSFYLCYVIINLNVLPNKYLITFISFIIFLNIIAQVCLFLKGKFKRIISALCYIILLIVSILGIKCGNNTINFLNKTFNNKIYEVSTYSVLTTAYSHITKMNDLNNKKVEYLSIDSNKDDVINAIDSLIKVDFISNEDIYSIYDNLVSKKNDAIVIDNSYLDILRDTLKIDEETKTIYTFEIKHEKNQESQEIKVLKPMNIYISGSDSRSEVIYNKSRSDVNMILTINPDTKTILMTSIPRDYYVSVYGKTGLKDKLTHAGIYGVDTSKKTLENLFNIKIDYAIKVNFNSVVELVDLVDGIDIESDKEFDSYHIKGWKVSKGINHMDGRHALAYARERYAYLEGDNHRIMNQQQVLEATMTKIISDEKILLKYDKLLNSLSKFYVTDIPKSAITLFVKSELNDIKPWKFESARVTGIGASSNTYTSPKSKTYVMIPNDESVSLATDKMNKVLGY